jgi:pilus assembly protein CpaE
MKNPRGAAGPPRISLVARNPQVLELAPRALQIGCKIPVEVLSGTLEQHVDALSIQPPALLVLELQQPYTSDLAFLERLSDGRNGRGPPVIVIGSGLDESATRALLRLSVADWLPFGSSVEELVGTARRVMQAAQPGVAPTGATIVSFMPVLGGVGASTLCMAALEVHTRAKKSQRNECCIVDLNFENGTIADYLDAPPRLDLDEIATAPERLDGHLLEVMLSQHKSGYAVLAAMNALSVDPRIDGQIISRLLDLVASRFRYVVIDLPPNWMSWSEILLRGSDKFYFVTDMSVAGLRHARRLAETVAAKHAMPMTGSVIVNKTVWLSGTGINKGNAKEVLGPYLAGFVAHGGKHVQIAQNHGQLLSEVKKKSPLIGATGKLIFGK